MKAPVSPVCTSHHWRPWSSTKCGITEAPVVLLLAACRGQEDVERQQSLTWVLCFECLSCLFLVWYQVLFSCLLFVWHPRRNQGIPLPSILLPSVFLFWYRGESKSVVCHTESHRLYKLVVWGRVIIQWVFGSYESCSFTWTNFAMGSPIKLDGILLLPQLYVLRAWLWI